MNIYSIDYFFVMATATLHDDRAVELAEMFRLSATQIVRQALDELRLMEGTPAQHEAR